MGEGAESPAPGDKASDAAELRQIDALNRIEPQPDPFARGGPGRDSDRDEGQGRREGDAVGEGQASGDAAEHADTPAGTGTAADAAAGATRATRQAGELRGTGRGGARSGAPRTPSAPAAGPRDGSGAADLTSPQRHDALLVESGHELAMAETLADALRAVARLNSPGFPVDGLVVFGVTGTFLNVIGQYNYRRTMDEEIFRMPMTTRFPATEVVRTGRAVYLPSAREYADRFPATWPLAARFGRESWAFVPLVVAGRLTGVCLMAFAAPMAFTADERGLLGLVARLLAQALERTRTSSAELALSRGLRRSMGATTPASPGLSVATRYVPTGGGQVVGGDWYDVINLPNGRIALVIGDVEGHDVHAAGLMAQLRTAVHAYAAEGHGPDAVLTRTSRFLTALDHDRYATCLYIEAEPDTGLLHLARAGHPHPVLRLPDGTCMIKHVRGGLPLGLMPGEHDYPVTDLRLQPGEIMMLCTDGLIETGGHDMFSGWVRVRDAMVPGPAADLEGMAERLIRAVHHPMEQYEQDDARTAGRPAVPEELYGPGGRARHDSGNGRGGDAGAARSGRGRLVPRNEDDIALLLLRRDSPVRRVAVPERRLLLTVGQEEAAGLSEARAELRELLHDWQEPDQVDTAVLLASELVGNVLVHTDQQAALTATIAGAPGRRRLRVEVTDRGDALPHRRAPGELASSGRGLMMLDLMSLEWSVRPESEGKTVWFCLDEDQAPPQPLAV